MFGIRRGDFNSLAETKLDMTALRNTTLAEDNATDYYHTFSEGDFYYYEDTDSPFDGFYLQIYATINTIYAYCLLSISIVCVLGNIVTIVVFQRGRKCNNSWSAFSFTALAVADLYVLSSSVLPNSLDALGCIDLYKNATVCTLNHFNYDFCILISTWITVTITLDRAFAVTFPLKCANLATLKRLCIKIAIICLVSAAVNLPVVFQLDYSEYQCFVDREGVLYLVYFLITEGVLLCVLPAVINIACNVIILRALFRRASDAAEMGLAESHVTSRRNDVNTVMYRVIAIGAVHLLSTFPMMTYLILFALRKYTGTQSEPTISHSTELTWNYVGAAAFYLNSGVNCVLYGIVGSDFRRDLKQMLCVIPARGSRAMSTSGGVTESSRV